MAAKKAAPKAEAAPKPAAPKTQTPKTAAPKTAAPKAPAARKSASNGAKAPLSPTFSANARADISPDELRKLISEAAYYRAKQRNFEPGHELEDWIQAEAEVIRRLNGNP